MSVDLKKCRVFLCFCTLFLSIIAISVFLYQDAMASQNPETIVETTSYGLSSSTVTMEADYGYGSTAKGSRYVPVRVSLTNEDDRVFGGTIQILSMETDNTVYRYDYPIELDTAEQKKETYYIPLGNRADQLYVILVDEEGKEVIRQRLKLNVSLEAAELLIGVLSDTPDALDYMDGVGINYSMLRTKTAQLSADMMPDDKRGLDLLDVILVTNYNLKQLSSNQMEALLAWVENGGILLLGTGERVSDTLGVLSHLLVDEPYGAPARISVDMGVEYATNGPGDSYIEASCSNISLRNGNVVLSSDELPVLSVVEAEKGMVAVAAYDFTEIASFCREQHSYVEKIFLSLLGEEDINLLANAVYNGQSAQYWSIQNVINTGDVNKLPPIVLYVVTVALYLLIVSPLLYLFLRKKDLSRHYRLAAAFTAFLFTGIIYIMGSKTRFQDTFFNFASIKDATEDTLTELTVLNMRTPYNKGYRIRLNPEYSVRPITRNYYDFSTAAKFTGAENANVTLSHNQESTDISAKGVVAFDPKYFILEKEEENKGHVGLTGNITVFDGMIRGSVTNQYETTVENAAVLLYGQLVELGDLKPGETKQLDGLEVINFPLNNSYMAAGRITGSDTYKKADIYDKQYMNALEKTNLLMYFMDNYASVSASSAKLVGFSTGKENTGFLLDEGYQTYGRSLLTASVDVNNVSDGRVYRPAQPKQSKTNSGGGYSPETNTMYGIDPLTLEYSLGSDLDIEKVSFNQISAVFTSNDKYSYNLAFAGDVSFYNYNTGNFDKMDSKQYNFTSAQLMPYLSPSNTLTVKYVLEQTAEYNWNIMLPMLTIVGREK